MNLTMGLKYAESLRFRGLFAMFDLLVKNGNIYDGTGAPPIEADIGVLDGRIAAVCKLPESSEEGASETIDASGLAVAPGFIDLHTHSDFSFLLDSTAQSKVTQGCTLELTGNCGFSYCAPLIDDARRFANDRLGLYGTDTDLGWEYFWQYHDKLDKAGSTVNLATQVGHGTVRSAVIGFEDRGPTPWELDRMKGLVADGLDDGALGFSTGLYYAPGSFARTEEVVALATEAAKRGKLYSTHMRDESDYSISLFGSVEESIAIGRLSGVKVQISHLKCVGPASWGKSHELLERIDRARAEGLDVAADQYPYTASSTSLSGGVFPSWALTGGREGLLAGLEAEDFWYRLEEDIEVNFQRRGGPDMIVIANFPSDRSLEGKSLAEIAKTRGFSPMATAIFLYQEAEATVIMHSLQEQDVQDIAGGRWVAVGSDGNSVSVEGVLSAGKPHPRSYGTFPRFLARYVRENKVVSLAEGIRKMTGLPASRMGLTHRGRIAPGMWADLAVFDPETVADTATFEAPHSYATGISHVVVNGVPVIKNGEFSGATPGRLLRKFDD